MLQKIEDPRITGSPSTEETDTGNTHPSTEPRLFHRSLVERPHSVVSASGVYLNLASGRRILDGCAGAAVAVIGHGNAEVTQAVVNQMSKVSYVHTFSYTTDSAEELANFILKDRPYGLSKAYLIGSGSEATDSALKLVRQYHVENGQPQRKHIVSRRQAYHGNTLGAMSISSNVARRAPYEGALLFENVSFVSPAYAYRGQHEGETDEEYGQRLADELDAEFLRVGPDTVAAFFAETVGGATAGCITPPKGYFEKVRRVCDKYGILLVLDEVMCGSGRTGTFFAFEQEGDVRPDIVTMGKGVGGGYAPIACVLAHEKVVDVLRRGTGSFNHGHTYQAHAVSCAAGLAVLNIVKRDNLVSACAELGDVLEQELRRTFGDAEYVGDIRGRGLFWAVEFVKDRETKQPFDSSLLLGLRVQERAFELGVAVYPGRGTADGVLGDHVLLSPPLVISKEQIVEMVAVLKRAYDEIIQEIV